MLSYNLHFISIILTSYQNDLKLLKYDAVILLLALESLAMKKNMKIESDEKANKKKNEKVNKNNINT